MSRVEKYTKAIKEYEEMYEKTGVETYKKIADSIRVHRDVLKDGLDDLLNEDNKSNN